MFASRRLWLLCVVLAGRPVQSAAQDAGAPAITGIVFDSIAAAPLRGASVQLVGAAGAVLGRRFTATSDSLGHYSFRDVPAGQ